MPDEAHDSEMLHSGSDFMCCVQLCQTSISTIHLVCLNNANNVHARVYCMCMCMRDVCASTFKLALTECVSITAGTVGEFKAMAL